MAKRKPKEAPPTDTTLSKAATTAHAEQVAEHLSENPAAPIVEALADATRVDPAEQQATAWRDQVAVAERQGTQRLADQPRGPGDPKNGVTRENAQPNLFGKDGISLTAADRNGPRMRFFRERESRPLGIMEPANAIQFDEKPSDEVRQKLRDNGWTWKQRDGVWKKPLDGSPTSEEYKNHKLFIEIGNEIRATNGLEPVVTVGNSRT